jgi:peptide deformylase
MIITNNEQALRVACADVLPEEVGDLIATLENELSQANRLGAKGIGLAAPQIGLAKKIAIIRMGQIKLDLVNAKLSKGYDAAIFREEGCLSFPGKVEDTTRFQEVYLIDNLVYPHSLVATGMLAVACQHEIDHYNGVLFTDHKLAKPSATNKKQRPNDKCNCNSGLKYKRCCALKGTT